MTITDPLPVRTIQRILCALLLILGLSNSSLLAQSTEVNDDVIEMSPFVINSDSDIGYLATDTLASTRIATSVKDVGSSLDILNKDFMTDIGAQSSDDLLRYSQNIESSQEYVAADGSPNRVRGLTAANLSRNFFNTSIDFDPYNLDRVSLAQGANSILFGVGSPSGVIDAGLIRPDSESRRTTLSYVVDEHDSNRFLFDHNQPLSKRAAIRIAALEQDRRSAIETDSRRDTRIFLSGEFSPFASSKFRVNFEQVDSRHYAAPYTQPLDGVSAWVAAGRPIYDNLAGTWINTSGNPIPDPAFVGVPISEGSVYTFSNGLTSPGSDALPPGIQAQWSGARAEAGRISYGAAGAGQFPFLDESTVDAETNVFGRANKTTIDADVISASWEQRLGQDLTVELAYNAEDYTSRTTNRIRPDLAVVQADVNRYLIEYDIASDVITTTNIPNPNVGRAYVESFQIGNERERDWETLRATATYNLDLTRASPWLGDHQLMGLAQKLTQGELWLRTRTKNIDAPFDWNSGFRDVQSRAYLDLPAVGGPVGSGQASADRWNAPAEAGFPWWRTVSGSVGNENPELNRDEIDSLVFSTQSRFRFLPDDKDQLVLTYGIRSDDFTKFNTQGGVPRDPDTYELDYRAMVLPDTPTFEESSTTSTIGAVYHTPWQKISLHYNKSDNFTPQGGFIDFADQLQTSSVGETEDYGVSWEALEGKLFLRFNRFEASAKNEVSSDLYFNWPIWTIVQQLDSGVLDWIRYVDAARDAGTTALTADQRDAFAMSHPDTQGMKDVVNFGAPFTTVDRESTGYELQFVYQANRNWNMRLTLAKNDATFSNIGGDLQEYVDSRLAVWNNYRERTAYWYLSDAQILDGSADLAETYNPGTPWVNNWASIANLWGASWNPYLIETGFARVEAFKGATGVRTPQQTKYRANFTTNYDFREGALKGFNVGGGIRYRSAPIVGYESTISDDPSALVPGVRVPDLSRPLRGDEQIQFDVWVGYQRPFELAGNTLNWNINLHVFNAFSDADLRVGEINLDGQATLMLKNVPRTISLTNSISF
jgi:hypothetical protein